MKRLSTNMLSSAKPTWANFQCFFTSRTLRDHLLTVLCRYFAP